MKLFLADPSPSFLKELITSPYASSYQIQTAQSGEGCFEKIRAFLPDLILLDLFLPQIHAIRILQEIKQEPLLRSCGVIIASDHILLQNYQAAIESGACYFLNKPFTPQRFYRLVESFCAGKLEIEPFQGISQYPPKDAQIYTPKPHRPHHYLRFWGTRGSHSVAGPDFVRFGGNTSCLEIHDEKESIILDAGSGICQLAEHLKPEGNKEHHLFIGHTHWDHITGLPFFKPIYDARSTIHVWSPTGFEKRAQELFREILSHTYFPIRVEEIKAKIHFREIEEGKTLQVGKMQLSTHYTFHPGVTLCFKIKTTHKTFAYITDNEFLMGYHGDPQGISQDSPLMQPHLSLIAFLQGCDFVIHEAQYFPEEYLEKVGWGHSSITNASILMREAHIKEWIVTHHDPDHTDEILQKKLQLHREILKDSHIDCHLSFAYDGLIYPL